MWSLLFVLVLTIYAQDCTYNNKNSNYNIYHLLNNYVFALCKMLCTDYLI